MTKANIIDLVAQGAGLKKKDAEAAVNACFEAIQVSLAKGEKVQIAGFGSFDVKERAARNGRNPATKEAIVIPASKHISFTAGKALKESVK